MRPRVGWLVLIFICLLGAPWPAIAAVHGFALSRIASGPAVWTVKVPGVLTNSGAQPVTIASATVTFDAYTQGSFGIVVGSLHTVTGSGFSNLHPNLMIPAGGSVSFDTQNNPMFVFTFDNDTGTPNPPSPYPATFVRGHITFMDLQGNTLGSVQFGTQQDANVGQSVQGNTSQPLLLWENDTDGQLAWWQVSGTTVQGYRVFYQAPLSPWRIVGTGIFDASLNKSILWRNQQNGDVVLWLMNGDQIISAKTLQHGLLLQWQVVGIADFNGDGISDVVFQNSKTGVLAIWYMSGTDQTVQSTDALSTQAGSLWQIVGAGDLEGSGQPDLLWYNVTTGDVARWKMNGFAFVSNSVIEAGVPGNWRIESVFDFNGDGLADIVWRNYTDGSEWFWLLNGSAITGAVQIGSGLPDKWRLAGAL